LKFGLEKGGNGFYGAVDLNNNPVLTANKSCVLNSRILWTFAAASEEYSDPNYPVFGDIAYNVLTNHFFDKENGNTLNFLNP